MTNPDTLRADLGEAVREARSTDDGISQAELARRLGIPPTTMSGIEKGTRVQLSVGQLQAVARELDRDPVAIVRDLIAGETWPMADVPVEDVIRILRGMPGSERSRLRLARMLIG